MLDLAKMKALRIKAGLTLDDAAKLAGFKGRQQWHLIESGVRADIRVSTLPKLAKALGCDPCSLLVKEKPAKKGGAK